MADAISPQNPRVGSDFSLQISFASDFDGFCVVRLPPQVESAVPGAPGDPSFHWSGRDIEPLPLRALEAGEHDIQVRCIRGVDETLKESLTVAVSD